MPLIRADFAYEVGGWGLGADPTPLQKVAVNSGGARTKMANSLASLLKAYFFSLSAIKYPD